MMRRLAGIVLACVVACAACGGSGVHAIVIPATGLGEPLPVEVVDQTGFVRSIELDRADPPPLDPIAAVDGEPSAIRVTWMGGMCDTATRLSITQAADRIRISETTTRHPGGCRLAGISRTLLLRLEQPLPVEAITFVPEL